MKRAYLLVFLLSGAAVRQASADVAPEPSPSPRGFPIVAIAASAAGLLLASFLLRRKPAA